MKILFEDDDKSPISILLMASSAGKDIIFCSGYRGIQRAIEDALLIDDLFNYSKRIQRLKQWVC